MKEVRSIVYSDGSRGNTGDFPVAISYEQKFTSPDGTVSECLVVDPVFTGTIYSNLYGRLMTLVEATTDAYKLKAVKDLFSKELGNWSDAIFDGARDIATSNYGNDGHSIAQDNIYIYRKN